LNVPWGIHPDANGWFALTIRPPDDLGLAAAGGHGGWFCDVCEHVERGGVPAPNCPTGQDG